MSTPKFVVEYFDSAQWIDAAWRDNGEPTVFKSREAAYDEIKHVCLITGDSVHHYRVVQI